MTGSPKASVTMRRGPLRRPARWPSPVRPVLDPDRSLSSPVRRLSPPLAAAIRRFRPPGRTSTTSRRGSGGSGSGSGTGGGRGSGPGSSHGWESFSGSEGVYSFGSGGSSRASASVTRSRSSTPEVAYELELVRAVTRTLRGLEGAGPEAVEAHQRQLAELDAQRGARGGGALPMDVRTRPDWRAPAGARLEQFELLGSAPRLLMNAIWTMLATQAVGKDLHPACVRLAVVSAGLDPDGALAAAAARSPPRRIFRSERRELSGERGLPLTGRRQMVTVVHADPRLPRVVGGPGDRYAPDRALRAWLAAVTRHGYKPEFNPRRRRKVRGKGRRYLFRVIQGSEATLWTSILKRMHADRSLPVGRARRWDRIFPLQLRIDDERGAHTLDQALRDMLRQLLEQAAGGVSARSPPVVVGMAAVQTDTAGLGFHALAFFARLLPARPAFYGAHGLRLKLTLLNPTAKSRLPKQSSIARLRRAAEAAARNEDLVAPRDARPVDIRRGALGPVLVDRLGPAVQISTCRVAARNAVQKREPSCGPSSFALMLAAARLGPAAAKDCSRVYAAVGDEDVVIAAQLFRQA